MDLTEARAVLGLREGASPTEARAAYRRLIRDVHPDVRGADAASTGAAARLNLAYARVLDAGRRGDGRPPPAAGEPAPPPTAPPAPPSTRPPGPTGSIDDDADVRTIGLPAPTLEVLDRLCEAADRIGHLSYVDRSNGILETMISPETGPTCSLLVVLRQDGDRTLAQCTLESLDRRPGPPIEDVVERLSRELARVDAERDAPPAT